MTDRGRKAADRTAVSAWPPFARAWTIDGADPEGYGRHLARVFGEVLR